jgi:hypothetical protein
MPILLSSSISFHTIKEQYRYEKPKLPTALPEKIINVICGCILSILFFFNESIPNALTIFSYTVIALSAFYIIKIVVSLLTEQPISVLIGFSLTTRAVKIFALAVAVLQIMVGFENLHIMATFL